MSETEIKAPPPLNTWVPLDRSLSRMTTVLEVIQIDPIPMTNDLLLRCQRGNETVFQTRLNPEQARHLAGLLNREEKVA